MKFKQINTKAIKETVVKTVGRISKLIQESKRYLTPLWKVTWRNKMIIISASNVIITVSLIIVILFKIRRTLATNALGFVDSVDWLSIIMFLLLLAFAWQSFLLFKRVKSEKWDKLKSAKLRYRFVGLIVYTVVILAVARFIFRTV